MSEPQRTAKAGTAPIFDRQQRREIGEYLHRKLRGPVSLELWTRPPSEIVVPGRPPCASCAPAEEMLRALAAMHPGVTLTRYDRDRHAKRADEAGIEHLPTIVVRGRQGAGFRFVGMPNGPLFMPFLDGLSFAGANDGGLSADGREIAGSLTADHRLDLYVAPYDPFSPFLLRLATGIAAHQHRVRLTIVAIAEYPALAAAMRITHVPTALIDGLRGQGLFSELELLRQIAAAEEPLAEGESRVLLDRSRDDALIYHSLAELAAMARAQPSQGQPSQGQRPPAQRPPGQRPPGQRPPEQPSP